MSALALAWRYLFARRLLNLLTRCVGEPGCFSEFTPGSLNSSLLQCCPSRRQKLGGVS